MRNGASSSTSVVDSCVAQFAYHISPSPTSSPLIYKYECVHQTNPNDDTLMRFVTDSMMKSLVSLVLTKASVRGTIPALEKKSDGKYPHAVSDWGLNVGWETVDASWVSLIWANGQLTSNGFTRSCFLVTSWVVVAGCLPQSIHLIL